MELPKNITQVGELNRDYKIYIEDYVISYMKQLNVEARNKDIAVVLYGKTSDGEEGKYYFVYGACRIFSITQQVKHLSQAQLQEAEKMRKKYFPELSLCGYCLLEGEMIDKIMLMEQDLCFSVEGYAQFYEKNDNMLEVLLSCQGTKEIEDLGQERYDMVRERQETRKGLYEAATKKKEEKQKDEEKIPAGYRLIRFVTACVFMILCTCMVLYFVDRQGYDFSEQIKETIGKVMNVNISVQETEEEENQGLTLTDVGAIVTEDALAQVIYEENQREEKNIFEEDIETEESVGQVEESVKAEEFREEQERKEQQKEEYIENREENETEEDTFVEEKIPEEEVIETGGEVGKVNDYYEIKKGDTLISISIWKYGNADYVTKICEANNIKNPDNIQMGQKILLP